MYDAPVAVTLPTVRDRQKKLLEGYRKLRHKPVYEDTNNIGARLLAKQGWTVGQGLGKRKDGITVPITQRFKTDTEGVGFVDGKDDQWTQHDADFNDLLKQLNGEGALNGADSSVVIDPKAHLQSLEERSKISRARVHYKKFTRGKDLSQANEKDLASIFGKRSFAELNQPNNTVKDDTSTDESENEPRSENQVSQVLGLTVITSNVSIQDYFKGKMKQKKCMAEQTAKINNGLEFVAGEQLGNPKQKKNKQNTENVALEERAGEPAEEIVETKSADTHNPTNGEFMESGKKKKKSKKSKSDPTDSVPNGQQKDAHMDHNKTGGDNGTEDAAPDSDGIPKRGKRKHETVQVGVDVVDDSVMLGELMEPKKKKKKSKKSKSDPVEPATNVDQVPELQNDEPQHEQESAEFHSESLKKKKKSKKNKAVRNELHDNTTNEPAAEDSKASVATQPNEETTAKKKKSKKSKLPIAKPDTVVKQPETLRQAPEGKHVAKAEESDAELKPPPYTEGMKEEDVTCHVKVDILKHVDETAFPGSNFGNIVGYRLTEDVTLIKKDANMNRMIDRHRFHVKTDAVSDHRKWQKLKKVQAFMPI